MVFISEISFAQITFQKTYGEITASDHGRSVHQTSDGGYIIGGNTGTISTSIDAYLIKTNDQGDTLWTKRIGGNDVEFCNSVQQTTDGGYIITGQTQSFGAGLFDVYLIKTDVAGNVLWTKTFGGIYFNGSYSTEQTTDGGFIIAGYTNSFGAGHDVYLIKTDTNGDTLWTKTFGGTGNDVGMSVQQTSDGGYIVTGYTENPGADSADVYLIKIDPNGDALWTKTYSGPGDDVGYSVLQSTDGGYIITGITNSFGAGLYDIYLIKTDANGDSLWIKTFGGTGYDYSFCVQQTIDGGYLIAGYTNSFGAGSIDAYLIKTDSNGDTLWAKTYGGIDADDAESVQQTSDGGYIITGYSRSFSSVHDDVYLIKTDSFGNSGCNQASAPFITNTSSFQVSGTPTIVTSPATIVTAPTTLLGSGGTVTTLCMSVGLSPLSLGEGPGVRFFPNPFHSSTTLTVNHNLFNDNLTLSIFNVEGKILRQQKVTSRQTTIERNGLADGLYFYKLAENRIVKSVGKLLIE
jgi:hypothetical protein